MNWKSAAYAIMAVTMLGATPAWAACSAGDKIDGTTADQTKRKIEQAGYNHVTDLKKGCDNYWHGMAMKDGSAVGIVVSPSGDVMKDGN